MVHKMNTSKVIKVLKTELKKNKITYNQVAALLKMSEAGVKKLFNKDDISLKKIEAICELMNVSVLEILKISENDDVEAVTFNQKQVQFFLAKPQHFHFFMKLAYEQKSPLAIQNEFKLSPKSLSQYLKQLEEIGLIKRHPFEHNQIVGGIPLALNTKGTELENFKFKITQNLLNRLKQNSEHQLKGAGFYLTSEQLDAFAIKADAVILEYSAISRANRKKANPVNFKDHTFMSFIVNTSMFTNVVEL